VAPPQTPLGKLTALPPDPLTVLKGPTSKGKEGEEGGRRKKRKEKERRGNGGRGGVRRQ